MNVSSRLFTGAQLAARLTGAGITNSVVGSGTFCRRPDNRLDTVNGADVCSIAVADFAAACAVAPELVNVVAA
jgi:hypothetical protein